MNRRGMPTKQDTSTRGEEEQNGTLDEGGKRSVVEKVDSVEGVVKHKVSTKNQMKKKTKPEDKIKYNIASAKKVMNSFEEKSLLENIPKGTLSMENDTKDKSLSEDPIRRSSRARKFKSALELLGVKTKKLNVVRGLQKSLASVATKKMKPSNSVAAVEGLSSGEIEKVQDLDESIGSCEDVTSGKTSVIDKPKSCILSESLESVVHEDIHIKTVKSDKLCTDNVKLNFVGDGAQSSNQKEKSRIFRGRSSKNLNQSTLNRKIVGLSSLKKDANKLLNDDVEQAIVCDKAVKDTSSYENGKAVIVTEQHTAKFIKHSVKSEPLIEHSDAVIAVKTTDIVAKAVRLSRSGRVISSPKKYNGYDTDLGQGGKCADPGEVFSSQKEGFCSSSGTSRKRGIKSFIDNNPVKKFKLVTEKNNTVTVLSDVESGSVGEPKVARVSLDLSMVKSEVTDDPVEVGPQEDPHGRSQVMQAEISPEGVITLTECILDKSGNPISLGNSAPDPSFITDNDVSNISPDFDQQECTVSTVVVKSDPDAEQDDGKPSPIELSGDEDISEPNSDPQYLGTEDQCESSEVLHDGREEEVTGDMDNHIVVISAEDKSEDGQLTYEALINLASEAVNQVEDCK